MKKSVSFWQFVGFIAVSIGGTLLHFLYDWTDQSIWIAAFSGVNESTWEHMKLLFFPLFIFALFQRRFFKEYENFLCVKLAGIATGLISIPVLFYTYNGAFGKSPDWINITIFFISAAVTFLLETHLFKNNFRCKYPTVAFAVICLIGLSFVIFTFQTPQLPLFQDPITGSYGVNG